MALHRTGQQIVLKTGTPLPAYSFSYCDSVSEPASKDVCPKRDAAASLCLPKVPAADTEEGLYYQQVALAAERWFSLCGWPGGPHPMSLTFCDFLNGACLCHIRAEYLLDDKDAENGLDWSSVDYESLSKRSWTDVLLQTYKVLVLSRVPEKGVTTPVTPTDTDQVLLDDSQPLASNVYSQRESHLLSWLNTNYQKARRTVWDRDGVPSSRWIVNFDLDLTDGLVLAAVMAAHCPYLIRSHFQRMYTSPSSLEQILHNNVIVVQALTLLGLNINIKVKNNSGRWFPINTPNIPAVAGFPRSPLFICEEKTQIFYV
uniref:Calponin-homology (CH) domain-containing protein n=1 Tax=Fundulus heteroclitus TaxID=8078 RepID=A0A3Q2PVK3_FUNHE